MLQLLLLCESDLADLLEEDSSFLAVREGETDRTGCVRHAEIEEVFVERLVEGVETAVEIESECHVECLHVEEVEDVVTTSAIAFVILQGKALVRIVPPRICS